ncbi:hypothetical protein BDZ89DRAFT_745429 [Hymenopellis radicata]|nr:hypothetical protein BDZ89DRAFT_745429 [Hymenopellis radicata]
MRFAPTFALFSLLPALFSAVTAHAINPHRSRTLSERQYRHPRPRADLLDLCVSLNLAAILGDDDGLLGLPLGILAGVDLCLCLKDLNIFLDTDIAVQLANLLGSKDALSAIIKAKLNTSGTECGALPPHAYRVCSNANPCNIGCESGYVEQNGLCVCASPTKDCNGKCAYSCASSVPRSPAPRSALQKRTVPTFQGSVFARSVKRSVLHIDTCDLLNILALSDIARVQVDLPILSSLNALLKALKLGGHPDTCPSAAKRAPPTHIDLCELLEGLSLGSIKVKADVDLGPVLNGLLNNLLSSLHLGGQKLSCRQSKSSEEVSCKPSQRGLVARTTDVDLCPLLKSLGLDDILKVKVDIDGLGPALDQLLNGLLAALGAGGFPSCGSEASSSLTRPTSDSSDIIGVVDSLLDSLLGMKGVLTSSGCGCSDGSDLSNALEAVVALVNQILAALGNVTDDLGEYISSLRHLLAELQCSLKSYSSMDTLPKHTSATVNKLVSACDVLLPVLDKTLDGLDSCGCKKDQRMVQKVKKHIADNPYITSTPSHGRPAEQEYADSSGSDSEPCEDADGDLVTELLQSLGLDDLLGTSTADLVNDLLRSLLGGGALLSGTLWVTLSMVWG